jgi:hypothetical protein
MPTREQSQAQAVSDGTGLSYIIALALVRAEFAFEPQSQECVIRRALVQQGVVPAAGGKPCRCHVCAFVTKETNDANPGIR